MCEHNEIEKALSTLGDRLALRPSYDWTVMVSDTQPFILDYKHRLHVYAYAPVGVVLSLGELGTLTIPANAWTDISVKPGLRIATSGTATPTNLYLRATDALNAGYVDGGI